MSPIARLARSVPHDLAAVLVLILSGIGCPGAGDKPPAAGAPSGNVRSRAVELLREGDPRGALDLLQANVNLKEPDQAALLGEAALRSGQYSLAEKAFREVLAARPDDVNASTRLAMLDVQAARYAEAKKQLDFVLAQAPDSVDARGLRAAMHLRLGNLEAAEADARRWADLAPRNAEPLRIQGIVLLQRDKTEEAIAVLKRAIDLNPRELQARLELARAYSRGGKKALSEEMYREAARLEREERDQIHRRSEASYDRVKALERIKAGDARGALDHFRRALGHNPDDPDLLREAGEAALAAGETSAARGFLDQGVKLAPANALIRRARGNVILTAGDAEGALADLLEAARLDPSDPVVQRTLARAYETLHRPEAEEAARRAAELEAQAAPPPASQETP